MKQLCSWPYHLNTRTPYRFLPTTNEPAVQEFCTTAQEMWIVAEEVNKESTVFPAIKQHILNNFRKYPSIGFTNIPVSNGEKCTFL